MIFYYSGCGNSHFIASELAAGLGESLSFIPDLQKQGITSYDIAEGEAVGFVFPIYAWGAPPLVDEFVSRTAWKGTPANVWFACTCGDEQGLTYDLFRDTLAKAGLTLKAGFCFQMPETYLAMPGFHLDTAEGADAKIAAARAKLPKVIEQIRACEQIRDEIVGSMPKFKSGAIRKGFCMYMSDKKYRATDACTGCGICAKGCPLGNISIVDGRPKWNGNCTQCMSCYHHCPAHAIQIGGATKGKGQYYFDVAKGKGITR